MEIPALLFGTRVQINRRCKRIARQLVNDQAWDRIDFGPMLQVQDLQCEFYTLRPWSSPAKEDSVRFYMLLDVAHDEVGMFAGAAGSLEWLERFMDEAIEFLGQTPWGTWCLMASPNSVSWTDRERRRAQYRAIVAAVLRHWDAMCEVPFWRPVFHECITFGHALLELGVPHTEIRSHKPQWWQRPEELLRRYHVYEDLLDATRTEQTPEKPK
ncbi:MAG: hypothetical protein R3B07_08605 [Polyangiaceae bacterium]